MSRSFNILQLCLLPKRKDKGRTSRETLWEVKSIKPFRLGRDYHCAGCSFSIQMHSEVYPDWGRTHKQKQETTGNNHQNWRNWEIAIDFPCKLWQVITAKTHKNTTVDSDCVIFHWMPGHRADQRESENRKRSKETSPSPGWVTCNTRRASNLRQWSVDPLGCRNFGPPAALAAVIQDEIVWDHNLVGGFNPSEKH